MIVIVLGEAPELVGDAGELAGAGGGDELGVAAVVKLGGLTGIVSLVGGPVEFIKYFAGVGQDGAGNAAQPV